MIAVRLALALYVGVAAIALLSHLATLAVLPGEDFMTASAVTFGAALWLAFTAAIVVIPFVLWAYRAHDNLRAAGLVGLTHAPGWAAMVTLIPIANLFVPLAAMRELANRSAGESEHDARSDVPLVSAWWSSLIAGSLLFLGVAIAGTINLLTPFKITTPGWMSLAVAAFSLILLIVSSVALFLLVGRISRDQRNCLGVSDVFS